MKKVRKYVPHKIYTNLAKFLQYRELELVSGNIAVGMRNKAQDKKTTAQWLEEDMFIETIQLDGYVTIQAKDMESKKRRFNKNVPHAVQLLPIKTYIILIEPNSKYSVASADFVKLLNRIPEFASTKRKFSIEVLVVTKQIMKSNIINKITPFINHGIADEKVSLADEKVSLAAVGFTYIHNYSYKVFTSVIPESKFVAQHRIISREEEHEVLQQIHTEKKFLPKISMSDPPMIWLGGATGDMVECLLPSETTIYEKKYLVVIPT